MKKEILINGRCFTFTYEDEVSIDMSLVSSENGITYYKVSFDWGRLVTPKPIRIDYELPAVEAYYMWDPLEKLRNLSFGYSVTESRLPWGMPLKSLISRDSKNVYQVAVSDVKTPISIRMRASHYRPVTPIGIDFFTMLTGPFSSYEALIRIDERRIPFYDAIYGAREWFNSLGYKNEHTPDLATMPMYSTWYSYTKSISAADALKECREAVKYGMKTVIVDDGWQTDDETTIYGYCGDWEPHPVKFPDMKAFVDELHAMGMKVMLWYATSFMGKFAKRCAEFEGMYLRYSEVCHNYDMDPRYREIRKFLVETFCHAVRDWGFDGLKLDFINSFKTNGEYNGRMDTVSVEDATEKLLCEVSAALREINPDVLIEFRQPYFGPVVSTYGNMMRVWDCPLDGMTNRVQSLNLRLVSGDCAVHSDMMYWNPADSARSVALQLWGTMFSVPQISARMEEITAEQGEVLKSYLDFWCAHRATLMGLRPRMTLCENGYGTVWTEGAEESITMLSASPVYSLSGSAKRFYAVNITDGERVIVKNSLGRAVSARVIGCRGETVSEDLTLGEGLSEIFVPIGGRIEIM